MKIEKFKELEEIDKRITMINHITQILEYDLEVNAPKKASEERSKQMSWTSLEAHKLASSREIEELLKDLGACDYKEEGEGDTDYQKAIIRRRYKEFVRANRIPEKHIKRKREILTLSYDKWVEARNNNDFESYVPYLEDVVNILRDEASYIKKENQSLYDALLDEYEEGATSKMLDQVFDELQTNLIPLVKKYSSKNIEDDFLYLKYDETKQEAFAKEILTEMGFDFDRGTLSLAIHPFTTSLGSDDIRITTRYTDPNFNDPLSSTIHEGGHALYEMNASKGYFKGSSIGEGVSMGIHESQSRFWENMILKNPAFWDVWYIKLQNLFPTQLNSVSKKAFVKAINKVNPSFIRVNADEVTYSLHIILRYQLEKKLIEGSLEVKDLEKEWNKLYEELFSRKVDVAKNGCLQDVHWGSGLIGYFPTYALGNLYAAQFSNQMIEDFGMKDLGEIIKKDGLSKISEWLDINIHSKGCLYKPEVLVNKITNKTLDANYFTQYLEKKLNDIYNE
ncbi:MAG: carboxypeptidase M32 [Pleomorphochaeta sp.]